MSSSLEELLDYLEFYKVLIESKYYEPRKEEDAIKLLEMINSLHDPRNFSTFDFSAFRKKLSKIFHPDVYTSFDTQKIGIDNTKLMQNVNGVIDDVIEEQKKGSFKYGEQEPFNETYSDEVKEEEDYTKNDYFGRDHRFTPRPKSEEELRKEQRKERINNAINGIKSEVIRTKEYICVVARERFNAIFKSIPANLTDYINIKNRFERALNNLTYRDSVVLATLEMLKKNRQIIEEMLKKEISPLALNYYYNNVVSHKKSEVERSKARLDNATIEYHQVFAKYEPEYKELVNEWINANSDLDAQLYTVNFKINEALSRNCDHRLLKALYKEKNALEKKKEKCTTYQEEKEKIKEKMLKEHPDLNEVYSRYKDEQKRYNEAVEDLTNTINNSKAIKASRMKEVTEDYGRRLSELDVRIEKLEEEHANKQKKTFRTRMRYTDFLEKYQNKYENRIEYSEMESTPIKR